MSDFNITLAINSLQIDATVHTRTQGDSTYYDITFQDQTITIYKDTLYTWKAESTNGLSQADIQSIGEQLQNY